MYKLYDCYEGNELLGTFDDMKEVRAACKERDKETDGEWTAVLLERNGQGHYKIKENWSY